MIKEVSQELVDFINNSPTMYNAVANTKRMLAAEGFRELDPKKKWSLGVNGRYYVSLNNSGIIAFVINGDDIENTGFRMIGSHTDSPSFRIKSKSEVDTKEGLKLNVEPYGGMIMSSWFDRPLAIAGRVIIRNAKDAFKPLELIVKIDKPMCIIPNLCIHMNRTINSGYEYNAQKDLMPLMLETGLKIDKEEGYIEKLLAREINSGSAEYTDGKHLEGQLVGDMGFYGRIEGSSISEIKSNLANSYEEIIPEDILDYDLYLYEYEKGSLTGAKEEYISAGRLDNLASMHASIKALLDAAEEKEAVATSTPQRDFGIYDEDVSNILMKETGFTGVTMAVAFNNEEIGSRSAEGADSSTLSNILERISMALGKDREDTMRAVENSFMVSADLAHAIHPNQPEKCDPTNIPVFGGGPAIKVHAGKAYATDAYSSAVYKEVCSRNEIKYQTFVSRSDMRSGGTIGSIVTSHLSMPVVDVGIPILAMHSIRELANTEDYYNYYKSFKKFFEM